MNLGKYIERATNSVIEEISYPSNSYIYLKKETVKSISKFFKYKNKKDIFINLGKSHFESKLPHTECLNIIETVNNKVGNYMLNESTSLNRNILKEYFLFFKEIRNLCSLGYLYKSIEYDIDTLNILYERKVESHYIKGFIKSHTQWLFSVFEDIKKIRIEPSVETDSRKCNFSYFLEKKAISKLTEKKEIFTIKHLHENVHNHLNGIYSSLSKKDYENLLNTYISLTKNTYALFNLLAALILEESTAEIKIDPLTGLLNRRAMNEILNHYMEISRITKKPLTVAMIDVDDFKKINDTYT